MTSMSYRIQKAIKWAGGMPNSVAEICGPRPWLCFDEECARRTFVEFGFERHADEWILNWLMTTGQNPKNADIVTMAMQIVPKMLYPLELTPLNFLRVYAVKFEIMLSA